MVTAAIAPGREKVNWLGRWLGRENSAGPSPPAKDVLPVLPAADLLAAPHRAKHVQDIERLAGIPPAHFDALYRCALESFARWVQQLPASEAHHHAGPGGMLDHALEVVVGAMAKRRVHLLPHGADPEMITREQHRWTYAVFSAALLHDIGKPAVDQRVLLFDEACREQGPWDAWCGPMPPGMWYRVTFVRGRRYRLHEMVSPLLARLMLPQAALSWLAQDHEILKEWLAAIGDDREHRGVVAEIVEYADGASVARNLGAGDAARFPAARVIPLHERLLTALRHLLSTHALPLNRNGSYGWLAGDDLWLVSKRATDALRDHLIQEGHTGIPAHNERIFDILQEHGLVIPNGERAIWKAEVAGEGWERAHHLTLLRFRAARIWPDPASRPEPFAGTITPLLEAGSDDADRGDASAVPSDPASPVDPAPTPRETVAQTPSPPSSMDLADEFFAWLRSGRLSVNRADARLHVVAEGVLLVSPVIFRDFAAARRDPSSWERTQKAVCARGLHRRAEGDTNLLHYRVRLPEGNHDGTSPILKGIVITDPAIVFGEGGVPEVNPLLQRVENDPLAGRT